MKLKKRSLIIALSLLIVSGVLSCSKPEIALRPEPAVKLKENEPDLHENLIERIKRISRVKGLTVNGSITVQGKGKDLQGRYAMYIDDDDMEMNIDSNGITVGSVTLQGGKVDVTPSLDDEYMEFMFAVVLRDSIKWWNIREYDVVKTEKFYLMRNSWKKVYVNAIMLVPEKQIVRLTKQREIIVSYGEIRDHGFGLFPSKIDFRFGDYMCVILIDNIEIKDLVMKSPGRDPLRLS